MLVSDSDLSDDELTQSEPLPDSRHKRRRTLQILSNKAVASQNRPTRSTRSGRLIFLPDGYREDESDITLSESSYRRGIRQSTRTTKRSSLRYDFSDFDEDFEESDEPSRTSRRSSVKLPRPKKAVDYYPNVDSDDEFATRHQYWCMSSRDLTAVDDDDENPYAMCQGCSFMFHVECLGDKKMNNGVRYNAISLEQRNGRRLCVLQCGRCSGVGKNGRNTTRCTGCGQIGERCGDFPLPKKVIDGDEMIDDEDFETPGERKAKLLKEWNDASKVLFRCMNCERAWHFDHLPPLATKDDKENPSQLLQNGDHTQLNGEDGQEDPPPADEPLVNGVHSEAPDEENSEQPKASVNGERKDISRPRLIEAYTSGLWRCAECRCHHAKKVEIILGWRPSKSTVSFPDTVPSDFKNEYLVKFEDDSYARALWVSGTWLSGVSFAMKSNFDAKELLPIESSADVILEAWLRADLVFDVEYDDGLGREDMRFRSEKDELKALPRVTRALCKWQKLKYEECNRIFEVWLI